MLCTFTLALSVLRVFVQRQTWLLNVRIIIIIIIIIIIHVKIRTLINFF
jgi:hypothetical protein